MRDGEKDLALVPEGVDEALVGQAQAVADFTVNGRELRRQLNERREEIPKVGDEKAQEDDKAYLIAPVQQEPVCTIGHIEPAPQLSR